MDNSPAARTKAFKAIEERRVAASIGVEELCYTADLSPSNYWRWRTERATPRRKNLERVAAVLQALINQRRKHPKGN